MKLNRPLCVLGLICVVLTVLAWFVGREDRTSKASPDLSKVLSEHSSVPNPSTPIFAKSEHATQPTNTNAEEETSSLENEDQRLRRLFIEAVGSPPGLPDDDIEPYLQQHGRSASTLLAAWRVSGSDQYLREAATKFPDDPRVQFALLTTTEFVFGESGDNPLLGDHRKWTDRFKQSSPDNALAYYFSAEEYFQQKQPDQALKEIMTASTKPVFDDYSLATMQDNEYGQMFLTAGHPPAEAQVEGFMTAMWTSGRYGYNMRWLGGDLAIAEATCITNSDLSGAQNLAKSAITLAREMRTGGFCGQSPLFGFQIEETALKKLPPDVPLDWLGKTPSTALVDLAREQEHLRATAGQFLKAVDQSTQPEILEFINRAQRSGDMTAAMQWLTALHPTR